MSNIQVTPENLRQLAQTCRKQSAQVTNVRSTVGTAIRTTGWRSPAATRFENDWNTRYVKTLQELERALVELGEAASKMAANYDATEAAYQGMA
jgi:WXG100 family type VII secretion target